MVCMLRVSCGRTSDSSIAMMLQVALIIAALRGRPKLLRALLVGKFVLKVVL